MNENARLVLFLVSAVLIGSQIGKALNEGQVLATVLWVGMAVCLLAARTLFYFRERP